MSNHSRIVSLAVSCFTFFLSSSVVMAVPADPTLRDLVQADGSTFKGRQWGDEWSHGWETDKGYTILHDKTSGRWEYARRGSNGELESSSLVVGWDAPPASVGKRVRPADAAKRRERMHAPPPALDSSSLSTMEAVSTPTTVQPPQGIPSTGVNKVPVILINFSDRTTTYTKANFDTLLFGTGVYSMKDFYTECSRGRFTVSGGTNGVLGWYTASHTHDYYGANNASGNDSWPGDLVYEAVQAADATTNFAEFDLDGDCYVDVVDIIHQGTGEESSSYGSATDIWSHSWDLYSANYYGQSHYSGYTTNDPCVQAGQYVKVRKYVIEPERYGTGISTIGVFAHEYGHALGLPDLYDTDYSSQGDGRWTIMAGGSWNYVSVPGDRPAEFDAWSKYFLGWVTPTKLAATAMGTPFSQVETGSGVYQILNGTPQPASGEYFLLENRQKTGTTFDAGLPGSGLLVWHIDETKTTNTSECAPATAGVCAGTHYKVALLQADGLFELENNTSSGNTGDPFPGSTNRTVLTSTSTPTNLLYSGASSGFSLVNISPSASTMTADVVFGTLATYPLNVANYGGSGTITSSPAGINCSSSCSGAFYNGQVVQLTAVPATGYNFTGWSGDCTGSGACAATMTGSRNVTANYAAVQAGCMIMRGSSCYGTLADAYASVSGTDEIMLSASYSTASAFDFNRNVVVKLAGGYGDGFTGNAGATSSIGSVTVATGTVEMENIVIR